MDFFISNVWNLEKDTEKDYLNFVPVVTCVSRPLHQITGVSEIFNLNFPSLCNHYFHYWSNGRNEYSVRVYIDKGSLPATNHHGLIANFDITYTVDDFHR